MQPVTSSPCPISAPTWASAAAPSTSGAPRAPGVDRHTVRERSRTGPGIHPCTSAQARARTGQHTERADMRAHSTRIDPGTNKQIIGREELGGGRSSHAAPAGPAPPPSGWPATPRRGRTGPRNPHPGTPAPGALPGTRTCCPPGPGARPSAAASSNCRSVRSKPCMTDIVPGNRTSSRQIRRYLTTFSAGS